MQNKKDLIEKLAPLWLIVLAAVWVILMFRYDPEPAPMFTGHGSKYANPTSPGMQCSAVWFERMNHLAGLPPSPTIQAWIQKSKNKWRNR